MAGIGLLWTGRVYGTNTGNLFLKLRPDGDRLVGQLHFADSDSGVVVYEVGGTFRDGRLSLSGQTTQTVPGLEYGDISAEARLTPEGNLRGTWRSAVGTAGTFEAFPHDVNDPEGVKVPTAPEQVFAKTVPLGPVRLLGDDLKSVVAEISEGFEGVRSVVTYEVPGGSRGTKYAQEFFQDLGLVEKLTYFMVNVQQPEDHGIVRSIRVEFSEGGDNELRVQAISEPWVTGRAVLLAERFQRYRIRGVATYKKFGLNVFNIAFFIVLLVGVPQFRDWKLRLMFVLMVVALQVGTIALHNKLIPNAVIRVSAGVPSKFLRVWPATVSWIMGIASAVLAAVLGALLLKHFGLGSP